MLFSLYQVILFGYFDFGGDDHEHAPPFHLRPHFYDRYILEFGDKAFKGLLPQFHMCDFPTAEHHGDLGLVPLFQEAADMLDFEGQVMVVGLGAELHFLDLDVDLFLLGFLQFFALLIFELAEVHDAADWRYGRWRDLHQVQLLSFGQRQGLLNGEDAELLAIRPNDPDFPGTYGLIDVNGRFSYGATS
jgi:hypothetical protein